MYKDDNLGNNITVDVAAVAIVASIVVATFLSHWNFFYFLSTVVQLSNQVIEPAVEPSDQTAVNQVIKPLLNQGIEPLLNHLIEPASLNQVIEPSDYHR